MSATAKVPSATELLAWGYHDAWARRSVDAIIALHTPDTTFQLHDGSPRADGAAAVREAFEQFLATWPDIKFEPVRANIGGDHLVFEYRVCATITGAHVPGTRATVDGVDIISVRDGLVAHKETYLDTAALARAVSEAVPRVAGDDGTP